MTATPLGTFLPFGGVAVALPPFLTSSSKDENPIFSWTRDDSAFRVVSFLKALLLEVILASIIVAFGVHSSLLDSCYVCGTGLAV